MWITGNLAALEAFGDDYKERDKLSKEAEKLQEAANKVKGHKSTQVGLVETMRINLGDTVGANIDDRDCSEEKKEVSEEDEKKKRDKKDKQKKAVKDMEPYWAIGSSGEAGDGKVEMFYFTSKEDDAKELKDMLDDQLKEEQSWIKRTKECEKKQDEEKKKRLEEMKDLKDEDKPKEPKKSYVAFRKARKNIGRRALENAVIEQDGTVVSVKFELKSEDDKAAIEEFMKEQTEKLEPAAKVIDALIAGEKPDKDLLKTLGGKDFGDLMEKAAKELTEMKELKDKMKK